jgi:hypothetical protein
MFEDALIVAAFVLGWNLRSLTLWLTEREEIAWRIKRGR